MAVSLKHAFTSGVADIGDTSVVQPSNWNAEHTITCAAGKLLGRVSAGTGAVEEITAPSGALVGTTGTQVLTNKVIVTSLNAQTGTTYMLASGDADKLITLANASSITVTLPNNASIPWDVGAAVKFAQTGAGQVTFAPDTGVTLRATPGRKTRAQYSGVEVIKIATNEWLLIGDLAA